MFSALLFFVALVCLIGFLLYQIIVQEDLFNKACIFILECILLYIVSRCLVG